MTALLNWRVWAAIALAVAMAGALAKSFSAGKAAVRAEWTAEKLATSETARLAEKARGLANQKVDNDLQADKARRAVADNATADSLRSFQAAAAASATNHAAASSGVDDPNPRIASECTAAIATLDRYASRVAGTAKGLQGYAREVCVSSQ